MSTPVQVLSWASSPDVRQSQLFNAFGTQYRFKTDMIGGQPVTTVFRQSRLLKEEKVAKLEWAPNGGLGRALMGKMAIPMSDLVRQDAMIYGARNFIGPDGMNYRWRPSNSSADVVLQDPAGAVLAFIRPTRPTRCSNGEVHAELHYIPHAGTGIVMHPPMMDLVTVTAMMYRYCSTYGLA